MVKIAGQLIPPVEASATQALYTDFYGGSYARQAGVTYLLYNSEGFAPDTLNSVVIALDNSPSGSVQVLTPNTYDSALNDTSTNAPQTKAVKAAVDLCVPLSAANPDHINQISQVVNSGNEVLQQAVDTTTGDTGSVSVQAGSVTVGATAGSKTGSITATADDVTLNTDRTTLADDSILKNSDIATLRGDVASNTANIALKQDTNKMDSGTTIPAVVDTTHYPSTGLVKAVTNQVASDALANNQAVAGRATALEGKNVQGGSGTADLKTFEGLLAAKAYVDSLIAQIASGIHITGYAQTTAPTQGLKSGDLWYNGTAMPTTIPFAVYTYDGSAWSAATSDHTPTVGETWQTDNGTDVDLVYFSLDAWHSISGGAVNVDTKTVTQNAAQQLTLAQGVTGDTETGVQIANLMYQLQTRLKNAETTQGRNAFLPGVTGIGGEGWMFWPTSPAPSTPTVGACTFTMTGEGKTYTFTEDASGNFSVNDGTTTTQIMDSTGAWLLGDNVPYLWPTNTTFQGITSGSWVDNRIDTIETTWVTSLAAMIGDMSGMTIQKPTIIAALNSIAADEAQLTVYDPDYNNLANLVSLAVAGKTIYIPHDTSKTANVPDNSMGYHGLVGRFVSDHDNIFTVIFSHKFSNAWMSTQHYDETTPANSETLSGKITVDGQQVDCQTAAWNYLGAVLSGSADYDTVVSHGIGQHTCFYVQGTAGLPNADEDFLGITDTRLESDGKIHTHFAIFGQDSGTIYTLELSESGTTTADMWHYITVQDAQGNEWATENGNIVAPDASATVKGIGKLATALAPNNQDLVPSALAYNATGGWARLTGGRYNASIAGIDVTLGPLDSMYYVRYQGGRFSAAEGYHGEIDQIYFTAGSNPVVRNWSHDGAALNWTAYIGAEDGLAHLFFDRASASGTHTFMAVDVLRVSTNEIAQVSTATIANLATAPGFTYYYQAKARPKTAKSVYNFTIGGIAGTCDRMNNGVVSAYDCEGTATVAVANGAKLFTLPSGYRPNGTMKIMMWRNVDSSALLSHASCNVYNNGDVYYYGDSIAVGDYFIFAGGSWCTDDGFPA
jgi:hypothetical protein